MLSLINEQLSWKDCLIEYVHLFHTRVCTLLNNYIFCQNGILECVKHHVCWYEIQHRLSLHCHIILWVCKNDVDKVTNEITTYVLVEYDELNHKFIQPLKSHQNKLLNFVLKKQLHISTKKMVQKFITL
jgi:hypothetical protein